MGVQRAERLPAPSSNLLLEISFCRLLASCEEIAAGQDKGREDLRQWQRSPTYHHYIETLQEQLADLEDSGRIHPNTLDTYRKRIGSLSSSLKRAEISNLCRLLAPLQTSTAAPAPLAGPSATLSGGPNTAPEAAGNAPVRRAPPVAAVTVPKPGPSTATKEGKTSIAPPPALKPIALSDAAKSKLNTQGRVQETLTDELADLAAAMKSNTLAMEAKVKERGTLLDGTEAALEKSAADTKISAAKATGAHRRGRRNFCFTFLVLFIIGTVFVGMYLFIRITSITGYKAAKAGGGSSGAASATPPPPSPPPFRNDAAAGDSTYDDALETHTEL